MEQKKRLGYDVKKESKVNNLEWYSKVMEFCHLSQTCEQCPFHCMQESTDQETQNFHCFKDKENLKALSEWLASPCREKSEEQDLGNSDNQWLKDLITKQFDEDETDDDFFLEEMMRQ
jgi:hypothetical protein